MPGKPTKDHLRRMNIGKSLLEGNSVLDVGCGVGHFYHVLPKNMEYVGVDTSTSMLEYARKYADADFRYGDVYDLSKLPVFDSVITQSLLIHLPDFEEPVKEMWKHTRKALIFSIPIADESIVRVHEKYGDKKLLSHAESWENVSTLIEGLLDYCKTTHIVEPEWKSNNVYIKVWRKQR